MLYGYLGPFGLGFDYIRALIVRIGFWAPISYNTYRERIGFVGPIILYL